MLLFQQSYFLKINTFPEELLFSEEQLFGSSYFFRKAMISSIFFFRKFHFQTYFNFLCNFKKEKWNIGITQQTLNVDSTLINLEITSRRRDIHVDSKLICQHWFIDKVQRWNNVDFGLTLKMILCSFRYAWKFKTFILSLKR